MDTETREMFAKILQGQNKLKQGQGKLEEGQSKLESEVKMNSIHLEILKEMTGKHEVEINILKRRAV